MRSSALSVRFRDAQVVPWGTAVAGALLVNATPLGMAGESMPERLVRASGGLIDLPYGAMTTPVVETARRLGIGHTDGVEFLAVSAAESFQWWTGRPVDSDLLLAAATNA